MACSVFAATLFCVLSPGLLLRYEYVPNAEPGVTLLRGGWWIDGHLDKNGDFLESQRYKRAGLMSTHGTGGRILTHNLMVGKKAFEYRSGVLVPGTFGADYNFIPEVGGRIVRFADYEYSLLAPPIYNLPGYFKAVLIVPEPVRIKP